ncbi:hypothetical protein GF327_00485 [Candidatus Woesearchaeota archaeon]|nr:hypothetical protein [Candidatus Woesearchaeota archaeon]
MGIGKRGRPADSNIRRNIVEILNYIKKGYGYEIYKIYRNFFPKVTMRSIYYHLNKGVELGIFKIENIEQEKGEYSWGESAKKIYYTLGKNAKPRGNMDLKEFLEKNG